MVTFHIAAWSLPELVVAIFACSVWFLGLSLRPATLREGVVLRAYRLITLAVAMLVAALFVQHSGLVPTVQAMWWCYLIASIMVPLGIRSARHTSGLAFGWLERAYVAASALGVIGLLVSPHWFVQGERLNPLGFPQAVSGLAGLFLNTLHATAVILSARQRFKLGVLGPVPGGRPVVLVVTWTAFALGAVIEQLNMNFNLPLPPVFWIGALAHSIAFAGIIHAHHESTARALEDTREERDELREQVNRDELTGLATRAHGELELARALETQSVCLLFIDLDDFKRWNDRHSHATGDRVLRAIARVLRSSVRASDIAARYAGDEFFLALPGASHADGLRVAQAIELGLESIRLDGLVMHERVRASIGVVHANASTSAAETLHHADLEAYRVKRERKNGRLTRI